MHWAENFSGIRWPRLADGEVRLAAALRRRACTEERILEVLRVIWELVRFVARHARGRTLATTGVAAAALVSVATRSFFTENPVDSG